LHFALAVVDSLADPMAQTYYGPYVCVGYVCHKMVYCRKERSKTWNSVKKRNDDEDEKT